MSAHEHQSFASAKCVENPTSWVSSASYTFAMLLACRNCVPSFWIRWTGLAFAHRAADVPEALVRIHAGALDHGLGENIARADDMDLHLGRAGERAGKHLRRCLGRAIVVGRPQLTVFPIVAALLADRGGGAGVDDLADAGGVGGFKQTDGGGGVGLEHQQTALAP